MDFNFTSVTAEWQRKKNNYSILVNSTCFHTMVDMCSLPIHTDKHRVWSRDKQQIGLRASISIIAYAFYLFIHFYSLHRILFVIGLHKMFAFDVKMRQMK